ncbi:MAG: methionine--tRNA ligase [Candidatus Spechtbacteria bacterium]|nr:methionine--tRNA ligase [Candidatus Spechtbacteria bacterium]
MPKKFYITTAIDYVNGPPHIGHAFEKVQADVLARYHRALGDDVFFLAGTDEHGVKNARAAAVAGIEVSDFVAKNTARFQELIKAFNISNDYFIRTTDKKVHWPGVFAMWKALEKSGDIYRKKYKGLYCVGHEAFITKKDLKDGKCELHKKEPEVIEEENYFFRLSKYTKVIQGKIESGEVRVVGEAAQNEILHLLREGLDDISFSRPSKDLKWGIPVPDDPSQTVYVWCDALVNYISAIGYGSSDVLKFKKYWPADIQVIGKDILRFHAAIWPAMLLSAELPLPKILFVHGFINIGGEKMSKSIGNVIDPFSLIEKYGCDAVRYYLLREIPPTNDGDFTEEKFEERYRADLARGVGNFTARVVNLGARHIENEFFSYESAETKKAIGRAEKDYHQAMENFRFNEALEAIWRLISYGDKFVDSSKLWELPEKDPEKFKSHIAELCAVLANIALLLEPFLPETSAEVARQLGVSVEDKNSWRFRLERGKSLFPMI